MANSVASNPIVLTTTITSPTFKATAGALPQDGMYLDEIYWLNPAAPGDTFNLTLGDGATVIRNGRCQVSTQSQVFQMYGKRITDFQLVTISSGTLFLYYHN